MDDVEARVLRLLSSGDAGGAAEAAIQGYGPAVHRYLCTLLDGDEALEVYSQWAEDLWRGLPGFRRECRLRAWVFKVAWHAAARFHRDPYRARRERLPSSAASRLAASVAASSVLPGGRREQLRRLRAALSPEDREIVALRIDRELSWEEIAFVLSRGERAGDGEDPGAGGGEGGAGGDTATPARAVTAVALRKRYERLKEKLGRIARDEGLVD